MNSGYPRNELLALRDCGTHHQILIEMDEHESGIILNAKYVHGGLDIPPDTELAAWIIDYLPRVPLEGHDEGNVAINRGRIEIARAELRGIGLGSLLMRPLIRWIKEQPEVPVCPINLSADDAATIEEKATRNRFYEKLGFTFSYKDDDAWGESEPMLSHDLITPPLKLSRGWRIEILQPGNLLQF